MNKEQEQWIKDILHSAQGKKVVAPKADLFEAIQLEIAQEQSLVVSHWSKTGMLAAALLIGILNILAFQQILSGYYTNNINSASYSNYEALVSDYNFYE